MPTYRKLYTRVTQSFDFNEMPDDFTRVLWLLLPLGLDCEGRGILNASWIKAKLMPMREDVTADMINTAMSWLTERKMIVVYDVDNRQYFYVPTFKTYQKGTEKEAKSTLPPPEPSQEAVESRSRAGREQVNAAESALASAYESVNDSDSFNLNGEIEISETQSALETITGIPSSHANSQALKELEDMHCTREDIQAGYDWLKSQGKIIRYWGQLVGPARTAMAKRANPPAKSNGTHEQTDTIDYGELAKTLDTNRKDRRPDYVPVAPKIDQEKLDAIPDTTLESWKNAMHILSEEIPPPKYDTWIRPAWAAGVGDDGLLVVGVCNKAGGDWLEKNVKHRLEELAGERIRFEIRQKE